MVSKSNLIQTEGVVACVDIPLKAEHQCCNSAVPNSSVSDRDFKHMVLMSEKDIEAVCMSIAPMRSTFECNVVTLLTLCYNHSTAAVACISHILEHSVSVPLSSLCILLGLDARMNVVFLFGLL